MMRVGSLFAGMGGFDLAAEAMGWSTAWVSEIDPFASAVLAKHFPHAPNLGDITAIDWSTVEPVDLLCGGFPCQPHSLAGKRGASDDSRDLWPEFVRAIGVLRPRYVVGENVPGLLTSESGRFFNRVISDLAASGYAVEWSTLSAADVGAPHKRERVWIVASRDMGDARHTRPQGHAGDGAHGREPGRLDAGSNGSASAPMLRLRDWRDALPVRGADGTVRLVPSGAVEHGTERGRGTGAGVEVRRTERGLTGVRGTKADEGPRPQPALRALADGLPDRLAGRDRGAEEWPTPTVNFGRNRTSGRQEGSQHHDGVTLHDAVYAWPSGGSLWPVTPTEPGRVAKLRAIGNAIVPLCAVLGPFARVAELERTHG